MSDELLDAISRTYSKIRGEHTPKEIIDGIWEHTFTPDSGHGAMVSTGSLTAADLEALWDQMYDHERQMPPMPEIADASVFLMTRGMAHRIRLLQAKAQRYVRASKRTRRKCRAAFRRRKRGLA